MLNSTETVVKILSVSPAGNRCHFVLLDNDESGPTAHRSNRPEQPVQWTGLLDR